MELEKREGGEEMDSIFRVCELENMGLESDNGGHELNQEQGQCSNSSPSNYLDKFALFETSSHFYMIGRDVRRKHWRVLKICRSKPSELVVDEDPTKYSREACKDLLHRINKENKLTGGLKFITVCYGIIGFIKFLESYYILLITERREIGKICGHPVYSISKYRMIPFSHCTALTYMYNSTKENRYKKLLQLVDIRDNFFFSCSYPLMHSVQQNLSQQEPRQTSDGAMFVWNKYLTDHIRNNLKNTLWTVALIQGFFKQVELSTGGKTLILTLIARRSCQFAGTRFERRGINEMGQAANDVEIEQIVWEVSQGKCSSEMASVVQNRGSIPLCWKQKPSLLNLKPDILFSEGNDNYNATRLHFQNLHMRYGVPVVILNLIKTSIKNREYILHKEFQKAVVSVNKDLGEEDQVEFLSLDLDAAFQNEETDELAKVKEKAVTALEKTGIFSCQMPQSINFEASFDLSYIWINNDSNNYISKHQKGILRTNCLDSLDRTNFAQYVYGMVALGHQLHTLGISGSQELDFQDPLAFDVMNIYQAVGDALAKQYSGSPAHQKIFSKIRGQSKVATHFQESIKSIQRYCSNSFMGVTKQQAIDIFLGHFQPKVVELTSSKSSSDQKDNCGCLKALYLKNLSRCNFCIYSGFERLWLEDGADERGSQFLTGPSGRSQHDSNEGYSMVDFSAGS